MKYYLDEVDMDAYRRYFFNLKLLSFLAGLGGGFLAFWPQPLAPTWALPSTIMEKVLFGHVGGGPNSGRCLLSGEVTLEGYADNLLYGSLYSIAALVTILLIIDGVRKLLKLKKPAELNRYERYELLKTGFDPGRFGKPFFFLGVLIGGVPGYLFNFAVGATLFTSEPEAAIYMGNMCLSGRGLQCVRGLNIRRKIKDIIGTDYLFNIYLDIPEEGGCQKLPKETRELWKKNKEIYKKYHVAKTTAMAGALYDNFGREPRGDMDDVYGWAVYGLIDKYRWRPVEAMYRRYPQYKVFKDLPKKFRDEFKRRYGWMKLPHLITEDEYKEIEELDKKVYPSYRKWDLFEDPSVIEEIEQAAKEIGPKLEEYFLRHAKEHKPDPVYDVKEAQRLAKRLLPTLKKIRRIGLQTSVFDKIYGLHDYSWFFIDFIERGWVKYYPEIAYEAQVFVDITRSELKKHGVRI